MVFGGLDIRRVEATGCQPMMTANRYYLVAPLHGFLRGIANDQHGISLQRSIRGSAGGSSMAIDLLSTGYIYAER